MKKDLTSKKLKMKNLKESNGMKITKKSTIAKIVEEKPEAIELLLDAGMMCVGCRMAQQETLEQGCQVHGMSDKEIDKLVKKIEKLK